MTKKKKRLFSIGVVICVMLILIVGCKAKEKPVMSDPPEEELEVTVYYGEGQGEFVVAEKVTLTLPNEYKDTDKYYGAVQMLKEKPNTETLFATLPEEATLGEVNVKDGTVYVDFKEDILTSNSWGSANESITIAALVNTLTEFEEVKSVVLTIEGEPFSLGHTYCDKPMERMTDMIYVKLPN